MLLTQFDLEKEAILNPQNLVCPVKDFPKLCIGSFSHRITDVLRKRKDAAKIAALTPSFGEIPIYKTVFCGVPIAFYTSFPGAAACVNGMEDLAAMGAEVFLYLGSCGVLDQSIAPGSVLIPYAALRDEGTSYHYQPAADEIALDDTAVDSIRSCAEQLKIPFALVKTWTTDALYRETRKKAADRKQSGCQSVDMECAALAAAARHRSVAFGEFFYAADNLDAALWEERGLRRHGESGAVCYASLALESVLKIANAENNRRK